MTSTGVRILLLVVAIVLFVVAGAEAVQWLHGGNAGAMVAFGLGFFAAAHLP